MTTTVLSPIHWGSPILLSPPIQGSPVHLGMFLILSGIAYLLFALSRSRKSACRAVPSGFLGISQFLEVREAHGRGQFASYVQQLHQQYGSTVNLQLLGRQIILTSEPENLQAILATQFPSFGLSQNRHRQWHPLFGNGIFTSDGKRWEDSRRLLRPQFAKGELPSTEWFDDHVNRFVMALPPDGTAFNIQELFFRLALDAATDFLFGECVSSLVSADGNQTGIPEASSENRQGFAESFDHAQYVLFQRTVAWDWYWLFDPPQFRTSSQIVHRFVDYYVTKGLRYEEKADASGGEERYTFLRALSKYTTNPKVLRDQMVNVLLASRDDTASLLSSIFYFLARDPKAWGKLKAEVAWATDTNDSISLKEIQALPYLRAVVNETLRLFPPVPINARVARDDTSIPVGGGTDGQEPVQVKKGQMVAYSVWAVHRRTDLWGPDADFFRPERWEDRKPNAWQFLPFNGGPRACLGQQFAFTQASHLVFRLAQKYDCLENAESGQDLGTHPAMRQTLTMCHENGVFVRLRQAEGREVEAK